MSNDVPWTSERGDVALAEPNGRVVWESVGMVHRAARLLLPTGHIEPWATLREADRDSL